MAQSLTKARSLAIETATNAAGKMSPEDGSKLIADANEYITSKNIISFLDLKLEKLLLFEIVMV